MKEFKTSTENLTKLLAPDRNRFEETIKPYISLDQTKFCNFLAQLNINVEGNISTEEIEILASVKKELATLSLKYPTVPVDRLEFDYAYIIHRHFRELGISKFHSDNLGMWRWLSLNYFLKEVGIRRAQKLIDKKDFEAAAKAIFTHCFGAKARDIFPRRYFLIGERLYCKTDQYNLLLQLAEKCRSGKEGGFGNLINNLLETSLLSPSDWVSKTMGKLLLSGEMVANDKEVANAFVRYNGYKRRLLNNASENIFQEEICVLRRRSATL